MGWKVEEPPLGAADEDATSATCVADSADSTAAFSSGMPTVIRNASSRPGVERMSLDRLLPVAEKAVKLGVPALALFPVVDGKKTPGAEEAWNPAGLVPTVVARLKQEFPELGVIDVRSASRLGREDFGANRERMEAIRKAYLAQP